MIYRDMFFTFFPEILGEIYFRSGLRLVPERKYPIDVGGVKKIYIFGTSGIGNLIMLTPMIKSLRYGIPDAKIKVIVLPNGAKYVLEGSPLVDEVIVFDGKGKLREIRHDWPDLTIAATHRGFMRAKEAFRTGAFWRLGFRYNHEGKQNSSFLYTHAVNYDEDKHEVEQGLDLICPLGLPEIRELYMHVEEDDRSFARKLLHENGIKDDILFGFYTGLDQDHPKGRCWPLDRFAELGDMLAADYGAKIVIVGGSTETIAANAIADIMKNKPIVLTGKTTLRQAAAVIEKCQLFVSSDGGPMHIAAAMRTPVIGIFGPTDWVSHAPYGSRCLVVRSELECAPCHKPHGEGVKCQSLDCLKSISVDMLARAVSQILV